MWTHCSWPWCPSMPVFSEQTHHTTSLVWCVHPRLLYRVKVLFVFVKQPRHRWRTVLQTQAPKRKREKGTTYAHTSIPTLSLLTHTHALTLIITILRPCFVVCLSTPQHKIRWHVFLSRWRQTSIYQMARAPLSLSCSAPWVPFISLNQSRPLHFPTSSFLHHYFIVHHLRPQTHTYTHACVVSLPRRKDACLVWSLFKSKCRLWVLSLVFLFPLVAQDKQAKWTMDRGRIPKRLSSSFCLFFSLCQHVFELFYFVHGLGWKTSCIRAWDGHPFIHQATIWTNKQNKQKQQTTKHILHMVLSLAFSVSLSFAPPPLFFSFCLFFFVYVLFDYAHDNPKGNDKEWASGLNKNKMTQCWWLCLFFCLQCALFYYPPE